MRVQGGVVFVKRRAIGADDLIIFAHVEKDVRVIKRRLRPGAHELARADLDLDEAGLVMEMRNNMLGHDWSLISERRDCELSATGGRAPPDHSGQPFQFLVPRSRPRLAEGAPSRNPRKTLARWFTRASILPIY